tara:strand:- start:9 stop:1814 length:1806 start_codon:yes stop_codon:yes gene_type:complete
MNRTNDLLNSASLESKLPKEIIGNAPPIACFLNSLARESQSVQVQHQDNQPTLSIPLTAQRTIQVPLRYYSLLGSHEYQLPATLVEPNGSRVIEVKELIELIAADPGLVGMITPEQKEIFISRVIESIANTYQAVEHSPYQVELFEQALDFKTAEQGLLIGHSFHPAPKSREQFTLEDAKRYSPEMGGSFSLHWLVVNKHRLQFGSSADTNFEQRMEQLVEHDPELVSALKSAKAQDKALLPVHPWQWQVMSESKHIQQYIEQGEITSLGQLGATWYPTSSTRSLYAPTLPYMLKFSLSVKLTNSIRNLSLKEVIRGTRLNDLFHATDLDKQLGEHQGFQLMQEPAFVGLLDLDGKIIDESLVAFRDNPLAQKPDEEAVVLATLTQQNPYGSLSLVAHRIKEYASVKNIPEQLAAQQWFDAYCQHAVVSLFDMQANQGVVFLAHQQNIVMQLKAGFPIGMYYRDCQGTGYTDLAFERFSDTLSNDKENLENYWDQDKVRRYFAYYLIINSTFNVISAIASGIDIEEFALVRILKNQLQALLDSGVKDDLCLRYVLESDALCCKGNFFCYLQNFNENSIPDPAVIYFDLTNPLTQVKEPSHV